MSKRDKLSKDVEEQIQNLASDVYIQIEEKLTQLICAATPDSTNKKNKVEQEPAYLALQNNYQTNQAELAEKTKNFTSQIKQLEEELKAQQEKLLAEQAKLLDSEAALEKGDVKLTEQMSSLEQENTSLKEQLDDVQAEQETLEQNFQIELTQNNINFTETNERLIHENSLLKTALSDERTKLISEQDSLKTETNEQTKSLNKTIENLQQEVAAQKEQIAQEQTQFSENDATLKAQLIDYEKQLKNFTEQTQEQQQEISTLNGSLTVLAEQEQSLTERLSIVEQQRDNSDTKLAKAETTWKKTDEVQTHTLIEQKSDIMKLTQQLNTSLSDLEHIQEQHQQNISNSDQEHQKQLLPLQEQLLATQTENNEQKSILKSQQEQLAFLEDKVKQHVKIAQEYKQEINQQNEALSKFKQQMLEEKKSASLQLTQLQQKQSNSEQQVAQLEAKNLELANSLITEQADIKLYQKEVSSLKSQVKLAQDGQENILNRFNSNREKQEKDNNQVRETIKYLRDENSELITLHNEKKEEFMEQIHELESNLTEYRLKFEYAQKRLTQDS